MRRSQFWRVVVAFTAGSSAVVAGAPAGAAASPTSPPSAISATYAAAHLDVVAPATAVRAHAAAAAGAASSQPRGARAIPRTHSAAAASAAAPAAGVAGRTAAAGTVLHDFNGVSSRDSGATNFGAEFEPPDQGLCAGNGFVLEPVNSAYRVFRADGSTVAGASNVNDLFNEGAQEFTSDPRCHYDAATHTWFAVILFINSANTTSRVDVAVNTSGDPTTWWTQYRFDTSDDGRGHQPSHPGCPCLGDQPTLGIDASNLYVTTNEFSLLGPEFNGAQVYAIARKDLQAGSPAHVAHFDNLHVGGAVAASVQPALTTGAPGAEFFLSSLDPNGTFDQRLGVWALTHADRVATGGTPLLTNTVVGSEAYGRPPTASQKGSHTGIDSGDDRMQQAQFIGGSLWGALTTGVTVPGDTQERAGAAWFEVRPTLAGDHVGVATVRRQGYVAALRSDVLYPAFQADATGRAAVGYTVTGPNIYPSAAFSLLAAGSSRFSAPTVYGAGTGPYDRNAGRWGDYAWAVLDPARDAVWLANEYIPPLSSQTPDGRRNWGTRVAEVALG